MKVQPEITWINVAEWPRKTHFASFTSFAKCLIHATFQLQINNLHAFCKGSNVRFHPMMVMLVTEVVNRMPELRMTLSESGQPGIWNFVSPVHSVWHDDDKTFSSICTEYVADRKGFYNALISDMERYKDAKGHIVSPVPPNILPTSCIPELEFSSFSIQPCGESVYGQSIAPTIIWGKFARHDGRLLLPISMSIHHAAADGYHVAGFFNHLQQLCNSESYF